MKNPDGFHRVAIRILSFFTNFKYHLLRFPPFSRTILAFRFASACATATLNSVLVCSVEIKRKLPYLHRPGNSPIPSPLGIKSNKFTNIPSIFILPLRWECVAIHFSGRAKRALMPRPSQVQWWPGNNPHRFAELEHRVLDEMHMVGSLQSL